MTYKDYEDWANEYKSQVEILDRKLAEKKNMKIFATAEERRTFEFSVKVMHEMRLDCIKSMLYIEKKARDIKEAEGIV